MWPDREGGAGAQQRGTQYAQLPIAGRVVFLLLLKLQVLVDSARPAAVQRHSLQSAPRVIVPQVAGRVLAMRSRGLLQALVVAGAAAIASSSFVGAPAGAGVSRHARASSRAVRMMAYKVPEATQEEWVGEPC